MKITGTFLDEITFDIPSANLGAKEWAKDFDAMKAIGIDTVIMIRVGNRNICAFPSKTLKKYLTPMPVYEDLVELFLNEAERCNMNLFFGTYNTRQFWNNGDYQKEVDLNMDIIDEVFKKHGNRKAFKGWYISHEIHSYNKSAMKVYEKLANYLKSVKKVPIMISPYFKGIKQYDRPLTVEEHKKNWEKIFKVIEGIIDIVAFQDGHVNYSELPAYLDANNALAAKYKIIPWSNVESFDRDTPIKFLPIDFRKLRYKMEAAEKSGVKKLITFEFSHFMSPNSIYPSAKNLYNRYREWLKNESK